MSIEAFFNMVNGFSSMGQMLGRVLAERLEVPYCEDREKERLLGHRLRDIPEQQAIAAGLLAKRQFRMPDGTILESDGWPQDGDQLTEEVWTKDHYPDHYGDVDDALRLLPDGIVGVWFHRSQLCLVLLGPLRERVGIRSTCLTTPFSSAPSEGVFRLFDGLKKAATC